MVGLKGLIEMNQTILTSVLSSKLSLTGIPDSKSRNMATVVFSMCLELFAPVIHDVQLNLPPIIMLQPIPF